MERIEGTKARVFLGREVSGTGVGSYEPDGYYFEPSDYDGDVPFSPPYDTRETAILGCLRLE